MKGEPRIQSFKPRVPPIAKKHLSPAYPKLIASLGSVKV